jgi:transposase InsO family protein
MLKKSSKFAFFEAQRLQHERSGNVWDNAAIESFFSSLKTEV